MTLKTLQLLPFDIQESTKTNILITGQTHTGKTLLGCSISSILHYQMNTQVIVVDAVGVWKDKSDLPYWTTDIEKLPDHSIIYDVSGLLIDDTKLFLEGLCQTIWRERHENYWSKKIMLCLEEAEIYARSLRSKLSQELFRLSMSARNIGVRLLYITPRLANIATELVELAGQRYHGFSNEENSKRKLSKMYGKKTAETCKTLDVGQFVYSHSNKQPRTVKIPLFQPTAKPRYIELKEPEPEKQSIWQELACRIFG